MKICASIAARLKAFAIHSLISVFVFSAILIWTYLYLFPGVLMWAGAMQGLIIVAIVDLVLGPVLTFIVFDVAKKSLKLDLAVVALVQMMGLAYGVVQLESQRIVAHVLMDDQVHIVHKAELIDAGFQLNDLRSEFGRVPVHAFFNVVEDPALIQTELSTIAVLEGGPQYQVPYYLDFHAAEEGTELRRRLDWRLNRLKYNEADDCYWAPLSDKYIAEGDVCISQLGEVIRLKTF